MHKFDKMLQKKNIINKILVFNYIPINFRKSQKISAFFLIILQRNCHF